MKNTKKTRRVAAFAAAVMMAACVAVPMSSFSASAAAANTITISGVDDNDTATHTYTLYQLFSGTAETANISSPSSLGALQNVKWAWADDTDADTKTTAFLSALKNTTTGLSDWVEPEQTTAASIAKALFEYTQKTESGGTTTTDTAKVEALSQWLGTNASLLKSLGNATNGTFSDVEQDGYYIIVEGALNGNYGSKTYHLLGVYDADTGAEISVKSSLPTVVKKVKEDDKGSIAENKLDGAWNSSTYSTLYGDSYNDVADYCISEDVPFKLIATLPSKIDEYEHYYIKFTDHLDKGFVAPKELTIGAIGTFAGEKLTISNGTATSSDNNIKAVVTDNGDSGIDITVEVIDVQKYKPTDTSLASTKVQVDYNATLDTDAVIGRVGNYNDVYLTFSNNPNNTGDGTAAPSETGETPKDGVVVFTYELDVHKYDSSDTNKALLAGATFVLQNSKGEYLNIATPAEGQSTGTHTWVTVDTSAGDFDWSNVDTVSKFTSTTDNEIKIPGLDDGTYTLTEIAAPSGYNKISSLTLVISATTGNTQNADAIGPNIDNAGRTGEQLTAITLTNGTTTGDGSTTNPYDSATTNDELTAGNVTIDVANSSGTQLPGTGGIGTTLFYVGGGVLVAGAGVLLITKKRAKKDAE
ncbi:MAG: isopeptide-forming domain-containing fimbrial protein [Ruminococcus sp.]